MGSTVRRTRDSRSSFAAQVLIALHELGFGHAPLYQGVDDEGRDVLTYISGVTTDHPSQRDERSYAAVGRILRDLHDRTRGIPLATGGDCIVHGDPGPFNTVMRKGMPVALIDWDSVHAGDPLEDVGYAGWTWCIQANGHVPIGRQAERLRRFRDGYDPGLSGSALLRSIQERQKSIALAEGQVRDRQSTSDARRAHAESAIAWANGDRELLVRTSATFLSALAH